MKNGYATLGRAVIGQALEDVRIPRYCSRCRASVLPPDKERLRRAQRERSSAKRFFESGRHELWADAAGLDADVARRGARELEHRVAYICCVRKGDRISDCRRIT